eukprot:GDKI01006122.1.p1 GENE.GDKI01006122.1~~GDKI01006122.1.p1  ORF type:complete len:127 (+),score=8.44 GDKI01006122.1:119-499(+)
MDRDQVAYWSTPLNNPRCVAPLVEQAVRAGDHNSLRLLLDSQFPASFPLTADGETALHLAVHLGNHMLISLLLRYGADTEAIDAKLNTPSSLARRRGMPEITALFDIYKGYLRPDSFDCVNQTILE